MITFTVHEPADAPADRLDRAESVEFVKEGFSWFAAFLTPIWLLAHKLWLALLAWLAVCVAIRLAFMGLGFGQRSLSYTLLAFNLICGFEADSIRRWTLARNGWTMIGSVTGRNAEECERRFFESWLPGQPYVSRHGFESSGLAQRTDAGSVAAGVSAKPVMAAASGGWRSAFGLGRTG